MNNEINNQVTNVETSNVEVQSTPVVEQTKENKVVPKIRLNTKMKLDTKKKKIVFIGLIAFVVLFAVILVISSQKSSLNMLNNGTEEVAKIDTGVQWGNKYAEFIQKEMVDITSYDVSLADLNNDNTPEMLVKYVDADGKNNLKIFYIRDGEVFTTKIFRTYSLYLLYSVETKEVGWYIYISANDKYGAYTSLAKIVDGVAFDSDIKANTDTLVEEFSRKYSKSDYSLVFYQINADSLEEDLKNVVSRYDGYKEKINQAITDLKEKNSDREYEELPEEESNTDSLIFSGVRLTYGTYVATDDYDNTYTIILNNAYTVIIDGSYVTYSIVGNELVLSDDTVIKATKNDQLKYDGKTYYYKADDTVPEVEVPVDNQEIVDESNNQEQENTNTNGDVVVDNSTGTEIDSSSNQGDVVNPEENTN